MSRRTSASEAALEAQLQRFVEAARERFGAEAVFLFGSRARGEALEDSDCDLLVVADRFAGRTWLERIQWLLDLWWELPFSGDRRPPAEPFGFTPAEVLALDRPLVWEALGGGRVLFDAGIARRARALYERARSEGLLKATERGWSFDLDALRKLSAGETGRT